MKDWRFQLLPEYIDVGSIVDEGENGYRVCSAIFRQDAEKILALRDSHAELYRLLNQSFDPCSGCATCNETRAALANAEKLTGES